MADYILELLLIEDDDDHAELIQRGLDARPGTCRIQRLSDGQQALDYLFRRGIYSDPHQYPRPDVILLDLRLPKIDGLQVLRQVKNDPTLRTIPVVVISTSADEQDIIQAYDLHVNSYLQKPIEAKAFHQLMADLLIYWSRWNTRSREVSR